MTALTASRTTLMCTVDCPFCDRAVSLEPGDDEFDCPTCAVVVTFADAAPFELLLAA